MACCCDETVSKDGVLLTGTIPSVGGAAGAASGAEGGTPLSWWQQFAKLPAWARIVIAVVVVGGVVYVVRGN